MQQGPGETASSSAPEGERGASPLRILSLSAAFALVTNLLQFWHSTAETQKLRQETQNLSAERDKTAAEVKRMQTEESESASRSIQSWLDQLSKFPAPEDRVMVLSAAFWTSPDDSVKSWAKQQMERLSGEVEARQKEAEQRLALATHAAPSVPVPPPEGLGAGAGTPHTGVGAGGPSDAGAESDAGGPKPPHDPHAAAVQVAVNDLARVKRAQALLADTRMLEFRPAPKAATPPKP